MVWPPQTNGRALGVEGPHCFGCVLESCGQRRILPEGNGSNRILILGESPWKEEIREGRPFAGAAGSYLDKLLRMMAMPRESFVITNSLNCQIPALGWLDSLDAAPALNQCRSYLDDLIAKVKPRVILSLGAVALRTATGHTGITSRQAYVHDSLWAGIPCVPTFHPSYLMRGAHKLFGATAYAFMRAKEIANGTFKPIPQSYLLDPPPEYAKAYLEMGGDEMACDIETPRSGKLSKDEADEKDDSYTLVRVGFSHTPGTALSMPFCEPYISIIREALKKPRRWIFWNARFDVPRLKYNGCEVAGEEYDAMWAWHFLQSDLPKGLDFVAPFFTSLPYWSDQTDAQPAYYNACDNDATLQCHLGIRHALMKQGRWGAFETHCLKTGVVLNRMGPRGILIDRVKQDSLKAKLEGEYAIELAYLQTLVPESVRKLKTWKKGPKEVTPQHITETLTCSACGGTGVKVETTPAPTLPFEGGL